MTLNTQTCQSITSRPKFNTYNPCTIGTSWFWRHALSWTLDIGISFISPTNATLNPYGFWIWYPNDMVFGMLESSWSCVQEKYTNSTILMMKNVLTFQLPRPWNFADKYWQAFYISCLGHRTGLVWMFTMPDTVHMLASLNDISTCLFKPNSCIGGD